MQESLYTPIRANSRIYTEKTARPGAFLLLAEKATRFSGFTFSEALSNEAGASFFFSEPPMEISSEEDEARLVLLCDSFLEGKRGIVWIYDKPEENQETAERTADVMLLDPKGSMLQGLFQTQISGKLLLQVMNGTKIEGDSGNGVLRLDSSCLSFYSSKNSTQFFSAELSLCGASGGTFSISLSLAGRWFTDFLKCGFTYSYKNENDEKKTINMPFWEEIPQIAFMRFEIYPCDVLHSKAVFTEPVSLKTPFRTLYGEAVTVTSEEDGGGGISFLRTRGNQIENWTVPCGKYRASTRSGGKILLLCGFSGTEYFEMEQNGILEFEPVHADFSSYFPFDGFSIADFINPRPAEVLESWITTAWVRPSGFYYSQPINAPLFGGSGEILFPADVKLPLSVRSPFVPILPYASYQAENAEDSRLVAEFEKQILAKTRGELLRNALKPISTAWQNGSALSAATPSGYVAELSADREFHKISVAYSNGGNIEFVSPSDKVSAAFRAEGLFAVIANPVGVSGLQGRFAIEEWSFDLQPGKGSKYNEYANILILKSAKGKLYDPQQPEKSLCAATEMWTERETLSPPYVDDKLQNSQIANLSRWILTYCKEAYQKRENPAISYFIKVMTDENWQGFIVLNMMLPKESFPACLRGILAGTKNEYLPCHHLGSRITPLKAGSNGPMNDGESPFFGLIDYQADGYNGTTVPPEDASADYSYQLLELKVRFENGMVREFSSASQFVLGRFLGRLPAARSLPYHALFLRGTMQNKDGHSVFRLSSDGGALEFDNAPFSRLLVTGVLMTTVNSGQEEYLFGISGELEWEKPEAGEIDLFSYDVLPFSNLCVRMKKDQFTEEVSGLTFDLGHAVVRKNSLCEAFHFVPKAICSGDTASKRLELHYQPLAVDGMTGEAPRNAWSALELAAPFGSMGALAGDSALEIKILLVWGTGTEQIRERCAELRLPELIKIENIIDLSYGGTRLGFTDGRPVFTVSGVALKLMGMLKFPESGSINLALQGGEGGMGWYAAYQVQEK